MDNSPTTIKRLRDGQLNSNCEKFTNNTAGENIRDNVTSSGVLSDDNPGSENNGTSLQVLVKDDERDLIELMVASSTIPVAPMNSTSGAVKAKSDRSSGGAGGSTRSDAKKRAKLQRDLSRDLALLFPDNSKVQEEKALNFAQAYFLKVRDKLEEHSFLEFLTVLSSFDNQSVTVCDLYRKVISILEPYGELSEEFVAFLLPEQAMELGVYMEYLSFTKMRHFLRKLEVYFNKQPQQVRKIYECLAKLGDQASSTDMFAVRSIILPLLKGSSLLTEYFLQLFPFEQPSLLECSDSKDFEKIDCGEFDESNSTVLQEDGDSWDWETVDIPDQEDPFGSDSCPCNCHSNSLSSVSSHCFSCGIKFINGRVFVHSGKVLRPARLVIEGVNKKEIIERIGKKTALKNDDKSISSLKHRKRPASDSSPVKNSCGGNSSIGNTSAVNPGLLSPIGTESEEDISDGKTSSTKVKSPRTVRSGNILKINRSKILNNKDTIKDSFTSEDEILSVRSSVLLGNQNAINENKESDSKDNLCENINDVVVKKEVEDEDMPKCAENDVSGSQVPSRSSRIIIHDDEDDDIEYIEIDDDDADDDVDVILDDDDDDDIEEDEEEITQNDDDEEDYEDIEVVEIDDDDERDMDVDYLIENSEDYKRDTSSVGDKIDHFENIHKEEVNSDESDLTKSSKCESESITKNKISEEYLAVEIKSEIIKSECNDKSYEVEPKLCSVISEEEKVSYSENCFLNSSKQTATLEAHDSIVNVKPPSEESSSTALPPTPLHSHAVTSLSTSWTKEEDKVILQTFQQEGDTDENFIMIRNQLPQRSVEEIKVRFNILMQLLKRMTTNKNSTE